MGPPPCRPSIAVVIPTYGDRATVTRRAVVSVLAQEGPFDLEVIVVDDASPNVEIGGALGDLPVRYIRRSVNGGVAAARNTGLDASTADWVAFLDSDDQFAEGRLERQIRYADVADVIGGLTRADQELRGGRLLPDLLATKSHGEIIETPWGGSLHAHLFRADLARGVRFDESLRAFEDWDFLYRVSVLEPTTASVSDVLTIMNGDAPNRLQTAVVEHATALASLYQKHRVDIEQSRRRAAYWRRVIAMRYRRVGDRRRARNWALGALAIDPLRPRGIRLLF